MTRRILIMLVLFVLVGPAGVHAQDVQVGARLSSEQVYAGDELVLGIVVQGAEADREPDLSVLTDISWRSGGPPSRQSQSFTQSINGRMTTREFVRYTYQYVLTAPSRPGTYVVPPVEVQAAGRDFVTPELRFQVIEPREFDEFQLTMRIDKSSLYVGEPTEVTMAWYLPPNVTQGPYSFDLQLPSGAFDVFPLRSSASTAEEQAGNVAEVTVNGRRHIASVRRERVAQRDVYVVTARVVVQPKRSGRLEVGPAAVTFNAITGRRRRSFFDDPFADPVTTERAIARADARAVQVQPLPEIGRPDDFSGLVGAYEVSAVAGPTEVSVGEPITLSVSISGPDPIERVPAPDLSRDPAFSDRFRFSTEAPEVGITPGTMTVVQTIRARDDSVTEIPPVELPYFDTGTGSYRVARSDPIRLEVRPTRTVTAADALGGDGEVAVDELEAQQGGIAANVVTVDALEPARVGLMANLLRPLWIIVGAGPMLAYITAGTVVIVRRRRLRDPEGRRSRLALSRARRALRRVRGSDDEASAAAVSTIVRTFIADRAGRHAAGITTDECLAVLAELGIESVDAVGTLLRNCDAARFAGADATGTAELKREAIRLMRDVDAAWRGGAA
jgi:hypothetical protein